MAPVAIPKVLNGVFFILLGVAAYWHFGLTRIRGWTLIAILAVALLLFLYGVRQVWASLERPGRAPSGRTITSGRVVGTPVVILAYLFFGGPALFFLWAALTDAPTRGGESLRIPGLVVGSVLALIVVAVTYWRLRFARYGVSICRLVTLPARVGGWLKADVACALPAADSDLVVVRLKNMVPAGRTAAVAWSMEQHIAVPVKSRRTVVPVRLQIARSAEQQAGAGALWVLEIEKKAAGIDFLAQFTVPVEVEPEASAPVPEQPGRGVATAITLAGLAAVAAATYEASQAGWLSTGVMQPSSAWLPHARFQREFDVWSASHYPASMQGRCAEGREEYRSDWEPVPYGAGFYAWYAMDRGWFEKRSREYAVQGFRLEASSQFQDCKGAPRFQGTWMKRMLAN